MLFTVIFLLVSYYLKMDGSYGLWSTIICPFWNLLFLPNRHKLFNFFLSFLVSVKFTSEQLNNFKARKTQKMLNVVLTENKALITFLIGFLFFYIFNCVKTAQYGFFFWSEFGHFSRSVQFIVTEIVDQNEGETFVIRLLMSINIVSHSIFISKSLLSFQHVTCYFCS